MENWHFIVAYSYAHKLVCIQKQNQAAEQQKKKKKSIQIYSDENK